MRAIAVFAVVAVIAAAGIAGYVVATGSSPTTITSTAMQTTSSTSYYSGSSSSSASEVGVWTQTQTITETTTDLGQANSTTTSCSQTTTLFTTSTVSEVSAATMVTITTTIMFHQPEYTSTVTVSNCAATTETVTSTVTTLLSTLPTTNTAGTGFLIANITSGSNSSTCTSSSSETPAGAPYSSYGAVIVPQQPPRGNVTAPVSWFSNGCQAFGYAHIPLPAGNYLFVLSDCPVSVCGSAFPKTVTVTAGQTTYLSVSI